MWLQFLKLKIIWNRRKLTTTNVCQSKLPLQALACAWQCSSPKSQTNSQSDERTWQGYQSDTMAKLGKFLIINLDFKSVYNLYADSTPLDFIFTGTSSNILSKLTSWSFSSRWGRLVFRMFSLPRKCLLVNRSNVLSFKNFLMCIHKLKELRCQKDLPQATETKAEAQQLYINIKRAFWPNETSRW